MKLRWVYEKDQPKKIREKLEKLEEEGDIQVEELDASEWNKEKRWKFYMRELMPLSIQNQKKLKGRVRSHEAGNIYFDNGVLIVNDEELYIGVEEETEALKKIAGDSKLKA